MLINTPHLSDLGQARVSGRGPQRDCAGSGEEFLEKIVQVPLHMPRIRRSQIARLLAAGLDRLLSDPNFAKHFDNERWVTLYRDGMESFFQTPRDVNRYLSSLAFHAGVFRSSLGNYEVNAVDLFGIETLRVFTPALYERLPELKAMLTEIGRAHV